MPRPPITITVAICSLYKTTLAGGDIRSLLPVNCQHYPQFCVAQGWCSAPEIGRQARRIRGGNHDDTPAIRGDSCIHHVGLSTEGSVMTALRAEAGAPSAAGQQALSPSAGGLLINIDNGGTLTDFCVIDGANVYRTKSVTTPYDLSKCLFDGLKKTSRTLYGREDLLQLLLSTDHIRYSTTQGTNALVERKGQRLGLVLAGLAADELQRDSQQRSVFADLVGKRVATLDFGLDDAALEIAATQAISQLASAGANRVVIGVGGAERDAGEARLKNMLLRKFPPHLLGAIPLLYSQDVVQDDDDPRRIWTALFNAFLHPAMERFLYNSEHRLREYKTKNPLLIFRNDGDSARISRTAAVKTYSSGPRGGAEGL